MSSSYMTELIEQIQLPFKEKISWTRIFFLGKSCTNNNNNNNNRVCSLLGLWQIEPRESKFFRCLPKRRPFADLERETMNRHIR